jgi:alkylation response protein AidB-like acyl-CoA dehydrogenase
VLGPAGASACARANDRAMRSGVDVATAAVQLHGGYGYMAEFAVERLMRDAISARARGRRRSGDRILASSILGPAAAAAA